MDNEVENVYSALVEVQNATATKQAMLLGMCEYLEQYAYEDDDERVEIKQITQASTLIRDAVSKMR